MSEHKSFHLEDFYARGLVFHSLGLIPRTLLSALLTAGMILLEFALLHAVWWPVAILGATLALLHAAVGISVGVAALAAVRDLRRGILGRPTRVYTREFLESAIKKADRPGKGRWWRFFDFLGLATPFYPVGMFAVGSIMGWFLSEAVQQLELQRLQSSECHDVSDCDKADADGWLSPAPRSEVVRSTRKVMAAAASRTFDLAGAV